MNEINQAWRDGVITAFFTISAMCLGTTIAAYLCEGWFVAIQFFVIVESCCGLVCLGLLLPTIIGYSREDENSI